ncbi:MAG: hypothetical protein HZA83_02920, partial [Thaumarchaeota archaeon]|nr:hypothetical protein [Nitrososphaerota archaeon]
MKKILAILMSVLIISVAFSSYNVKSASAQEQKVCCSETTGGGTCIYTDASNCKPGAMNAATTCEQTSFCKLGCGYDKDSGKCFKNSPKFNCEKNGNCQWSASPNCDIPQCKKGCCVLSNECSFTTQIECKLITSQYKDIEMNFKEEINNELGCINQCRSFEKGACVRGDGSCIFTTREGCGVETPANVNVTGPLVGFYPGRLCSNPQLGTECASQQYTGCVPDRDEVYWFDSCGNPENIYSSDKAASYNNGFILEKEQSCSLNSNNINSAGCGNCDYSKGSLCGLAPRNVKPAYGDYSCRDLKCDNLTISATTPAANTAGTIRQNGESWCSFDSVPGFGNDPVGSRHYRRLCINGIELTEPCKDFREDLCIQGEVGEGPFLTDQSFGLSGNNKLLAAICRPNRWKSCSYINNERDCWNVQQRDCFWVGRSAVPNSVDLEKANLEQEQAMRENTNGKCLATVPPGLKFWTDESKGQTPDADAEATCAKGNTECRVVWEKGGIYGGWKCIQNCNCRNKEWLDSANFVCKSEGDCGAYVNFVGKGSVGGISVSANYLGGKLGLDDLKKFSNI